MRIFVAGGSGVIGSRLVPLLVQDGHQVAAMTRSPEKADALRALGADPVVCDVYDLARLTEAVVGFGPEVIFDELTDLPDRVDDLEQFRQRNGRMRQEGSANLRQAGATAGVVRMIAQSIAWRLPDEESQRAVEAHELAVLTNGGIVIRYGQLYGPGTFFPDELPPAPRVHVDDAARLTPKALDAIPGTTLLVEDQSSASGPSAAVITEPHTSVHRPPS